MDNLEYNNSYINYIDEHFEKNSEKPKNKISPEAQPILDLFVYFLNSEYKREWEAIEFMKKNIDIRSPEKWFPAARKMKRKIVYHMGPTNSGKTYEALQSLMKAKNGIYCAPLRLLAWEVIES
jgi:ATP-dependent RNA helicase SUPV3L1/SUV3